MCTVYVLRISFLVTESNETTSPTAGRRDEIPWEYQKESPEHLPPAGSHQGAGQYHEISIVRGSETNQCVHVPCAAFDCISLCWTCLY